MREAGIVELLTGVQEELADGNALKKIDVPRVIEKLVAMTRKYGNLFQIPPCKLIPFLTLFHAPSFFSCPCLRPGHHCNVLL